MTDGTIKGSIITSVTRFNSGVSARLVGAEDSSDQGNAIQLGIYEIIWYRTF
jgi:hypothetical protein